MNPSTPELDAQASGAGSKTCLDIADDVRRAITEGTLPLGARLSIHRTLAADHAVSTCTIARSLDLLREDGYLQPASGRAAFIVERPPPEFLPRVLTALASSEPLSLAEAAALELLLQERFERVAGRTEGPVNDRLPA